MAIYKYIGNGGLLSISFDTSAPAWVVQDVFEGLVSCVVSFVGLGYDEKKFYVQEVVHDYLGVIELKGDFSQNPLDFTVIKKVFFDDIDGIHVYEAH